MKLEVATNDIYEKLKLTRKVCNVLSASVSLSVVVWLPAALLAPTVTVSCGGGRIKS